MPIGELSRLVITAVITKAVIMGFVVTSVVGSHHLTDLEKGMIIAAVSATITGVFAVLGAVLAVKLSQPIQRQIREDVKDVKREVVKGNDAASGNVTD